ncbi:MAG: FG-GAP-like repeat-containing protein [Ignavibacteriaceae bacterium]|nr:FG-GAP-like repeat-containing protein [Ignavibacteriaceae bacterium]
MKIHTSFYLIFFLLFFCTVETYTQDSLYLVDTLTGTATNNKLWKAQGIGDFNGDSLADFIICYDKYVDLYFGNNQFKPQLAHRFSLPPKDNYFKGSAYGIGDVNGDGYTDLMIITGDTSYYPIYSYGEIILGGKELDTIPKFKYYPPYYWKMLMSDKIYPLGDLNGDGYNDFALAEYYNWSDGLGKVYLFKGGITLVETPWTELITTLGRGTHFFGSSILGIGDYNDDGYDDFLVSVPTLSADSDKVYLYSGNKDSLNKLPYKTFGPYTFLSDIKAAPNITYDNKPEFILAAGGKIYLYSGMDSVNTFYPTKLRFGLSIGTGGDINNDGFNDLLIGNEQYLNSQSIMVGGIVGFWGGNNIDTLGNFLLEGYQKWSSFSHNLDIPGDINGDGYADVFVLAPTYYKSNDYNYDSTLGRLYIYSFTKITGINNKDITTPTDFILNQNYPNPFNPTTVISFQLSAESYVTLRVYNSLGQEIVVIKNNEIQSSGEQKITFDAEKYNLSSGVYFLEMKAVNINSQTTQYHKEIKMLYLK